MSSIVVPVKALSTINDALAANGIRPPDSTSVGSGSVTFTWTPDLSAADQTNAADLVLMANFGVSMTLAEWQSIKSDAANLKTYMGIATPTLVQTAAATKSIIRVLAVIVRD